MSSSQVSADVSDLIMMFWNIYGTIAIGIIIVALALYGVYKLIATVGWRLFVNAAPHYVRFTQWRHERKSRR